MKGGRKEEGSQDGTNIYLLNEVESKEERVTLK